MTEFSVKGGQVTLSFRVDDLCAFASCMKNVGGRTYSSDSDVEAMARVIEHLVKRRGSNFCLDGGAVLKQMGLKKFKVTSSSWDPLEVLATNKIVAQDMTKHLKNARVTEMKERSENA